MSTFDTNTHTDAPIWGTAIKWGVIAGAFGIVLLMVMYNMGMMDFENPSGSILSTVLTIVVGFILVFLGLKNYRDGVNDGHLTLGRGIIWSLGYGLVAGVIGGLFSVLFFTVLAPEFMDGMMEFQIAQLEEQGLGEDEIEAATSMMGIFMSPVAMAIFGILGQMFYALIEGLVASLILKTR